MALGSTQPLTEMSTRNLPGCKVPGVLAAVGLLHSLLLLSEVSGVVELIPGRLLWFRLWVSASLC
jgi:hypothetical protein